MEMAGDKLLGDVSVFVDQYNRMERRCKELEQSQFNAQKFYAVAIGTDTVARMHDVSPHLVRKYVEMGLIPRHPKSTPAKIFIRCSDALLLDFECLRREAKLRKDYGCKD